MSVCVKASQVIALVWTHESAAVVSGSCMLLFGVEVLGNTSWSDDSQNDSS